VGRSNVATRHRGVLIAAAGMTALAACSGGGGPDCRSALDCPAPASACKVAVCEASGRCATAPPAVYFQERFANNDAGWTLGAEWQIGAAMASACSALGNEDPATDFTGEGGVAGVNIGGCAIVALPDPTHGPYYLTSPVIDTRTDGEVFLTFRRWLNSDSAPYMVNTVDVFDGLAWTVLWQSDVDNVWDAAWTFAAIDVTAYKGATAQFRWGFSVGAVGVNAVSGWNLDDVRVQEAACGG
jgi:hypothetical protein